MCLVLILCWLWLSNLSALCFYVVSSSLGYLSVCLHRPVQSLALGTSDLSCSWVCSAFWIRCLLRRYATKSKAFYWCLDLHHAGSYKNLQVVSPSESQKSAGCPSSRIYRAASRSKRNSHVFPHYTKHVNPPSRSRWSFEFFWRGPYLLNSIL